MIGKSKSDLCMDTVSKQKRSEIMTRIKSCDSKIEILFRKELWKRGFRYRKNFGKYFGKPDVVLKKYKTAIFIDSCFWHGCKKHCRIPTANKKYWVEKITKNIKRDKKVSLYYKEKSWKICRVWEHNVNKKTIDKLVCDLKKEIYGVRIRNSKSFDRYKRKV